MPAYLHADDFFSVESVPCFQAVESTVSDSLQPYLHMATDTTAHKSRPSGTNSTSTLYALVAAKESNVDAIISEWRAALNPPDTEHGQIITFSASDLTGPVKVVLTVPDSRVPACVSYIARREEVIWLQERPQYATKNLAATKIVQGGISNPTHTIWQAGITGRGQIVGVADTGLDWRSSFFRDDANSVVFCATALTDGQSARRLCHALRLNHTFRHANSPNIWAGTRS
jgi:hypothetical protein